MERRNGYSKDLTGAPIKCAVKSIAMAGGLIYAILIISGCVGHIAHPVTPVRRLVYEMLVFSLIYWCIVIGYAFCAAFLDYNAARKSCFFHADIPNDVPDRGWIIGLMSVFLPMYLFSRWRMRKWEHKYGQAIVDLPKLAPQGREAEEAYQEFRLDAWPTVKRNSMAFYEGQIQESQQELARLRKVLSETQTAIEAKQQDITMRKKQLEDEANKNSPWLDKNSCREILALPGVRQMHYVERLNTAKKQLCVEVSICCRLRNYTYDAGSFQIWLGSSDFTCEPVLPRMSAGARQLLAKHLDDRQCFRIGDVARQKAQDAMSYGNYFFAISTIIDDLQSQLNRIVENAPEHFQRFRAAKVSAT